MNVKGDRYDYWLSQHSARIKSGQTITEFCGRRGISASAYRQAIARYGLAEGGTKQSKRDFIEVTGSDSGDRRSLDFSVKKIFVYKRLA
jgi:hypothetical protein